MTLAAHDEDFFLWTRQQADALRRLAETRPNVDIDWPNLIEELEDLGSEQAHAVQSHLRVILVHLLALAYSKEENPRRHWKGEILEQRSRLESRIHDSPSLRPKLPEFLAVAYRQARKQAALKLDVDISQLLVDGPFTLEQVLDDDWFPGAPSEGSAG
jgi:hypothetical protein